MCEALRIEARYNTPDENGETRRMRNARFGEPSPEPEYPYASMYLRKWYGQAVLTRRYDDGIPQMIPHTEWRAWAENTGQMIREEEFQVLTEMDHAYVSALRAEISAHRSRQNSSKKGKR